MIDSAKLLCITVFVHGALSKVRFTITVHFS